MSVNSSRPRAAAPPVLPALLPIIAVVFMAGKDILKGVAQPDGPVELGVAITLLKRLPEAFSARSRQAAQDPESN